MATWGKIDFYKTERDSNWVPVRDYLKMIPPSGDKLFLVRCKTKVKNIRYKRLKGTLFGRAEALSFEWQVFIIIRLLII